MEEYRINLEKAGEAEINTGYYEETPEITSEYLKQTTSISGWLSFFLFAVGLGGLVSAVYPIATFDVAEYDGSYLLASCDVFLGFMCLFIGIYTIYSFVQRKPNAVFVAKIYVVLIFVMNLVNLVMGGLESGNGIGSANQVVKGVIWGVIWYLYLIKSKKVAEVIPHDFRCRQSLDYYIIGALVILPVIILTVALHNALGNNESRRAEMIENVVLAPGEHTDGVAVFRVPDYFSCEWEDVEPAPGNKIRVYTIEAPGIIANICSDFDGDTSDKNFMEYVDGWRNDEFAGDSSELVFDEKGEINGNQYRYMVTRFYDEEGEVAWRYILVYDKDDDKLTLVSAYDGYPDSDYKWGPDDYLHTLIEGIRFR